MTQFESRPATHAQTGTTFSDSIRVELRFEQDALESSPAVRALRDPALTLSMYADILARWYRIISALQPGVDVALSQVSPEMGWLELDLQGLGRIPSPRWSDVPSMTPAESLGYRFVIEGQHRFSRSLLPGIVANIGAATDSFAFLGAHGSDDSHWYGVLYEIDACPDTRRRDLLIGARATMVSLQKALSTV